MAGLDPVKVGLAVLVVIMAGMSGYLYLQDGSVSPDRAGAIVADTLNMQSTASIESVVRTTPSLYKVFVDTTPEQDGGIQPVYLTADGSHIVNSPLNITDYRNRYDARNAFISCLSDEGFMMYGNLSQTATRYQVQIFGGASNLSMIYRSFDPRNQTQVQMVQSSGVQILPFHTVNGTAFAQGVQGIGNLEGVTGCEYAYSDTSIRLTAP